MHVHKIATISSGKLNELCKAKILETVFYEDGKKRWGYFGHFLYPASEFIGFISHPLTETAHLIFWRKIFTQLSSSCII